MAGVSEIRPEKTAQKVYYANNESTISLKGIVTYVHVEFAILPRKKADSAVLSRTVIRPTLQSDEGIISPVDFILCPTREAAWSRWHQSS